VGRKGKGRLHHGFLGRSTPLSSCVGYVTLILLLLGLLIILVILVRAFNRHPSSLDLFLHVGIDTAASQI